MSKKIQSSKQLGAAVFIAAISNNITSIFWNKKNDKQLKISEQNSVMPSLVVAFILFFVAFVPSDKLFADVTPNFVSASVNGSALTINYDESINQNNTDGSYYSIGGASYGSGVNSVSVSGSQVTLSLAGSVLYGENITLNYSGQNSGNGIIDNNTGNSTDFANSLSGQSVTNNSSPPPSLSSAVIDGTTLTLTYDQSLNGVSIPATSDFIVNANGSAANIGSVNVIGSTVVLTLATSVNYLDPVSISYTPGSNPIQNSNGNAASLSGQNVTNDTAVPSLSSAVVDGTALTLTYDQTLNTGSVPATGDFVVSENGSPVSVSSINISGAQVSLTLGTSAAFGETVNLDYTPGSNPIQGINGGNVASLSVQSVTNNTTSLSFSTATVTGSALTLTYNHPLDTGSTPAVSDFVVHINGTSRSISAVNITGSTAVVTLASPALFADLATIDYTPGVHPIQTSPSDMAAALSGQSVENANTTSCGNISIGATPIFFSVVGDKIYINNQSSNNVSVIDSSTDKVLSTITVGNTPVYSSVVGSKLYVSNRNDNSISVIDTLADTVSTTITLAGNPDYSTVVGTKLYVVLQNVNKVAVIDTTTNTVSATINVGNNPRTSVLVGRKLYVSNQNSGTVSVINTDTNAVVATVTVGAGPIYMAALNGKVYVANDSSNTPGISVIDTSTDTVSSSFNTSGAMYFPIATGTKVYFTVYNGGLYILDTNSNTLTHQNTSAGTWYASVHGPDLYVGDAVGSIDIYDTSTDTLIKSIPVPDGTSFLSVVKNKLYSLNVSSSNVSVVDVSTNELYNVCSPHLTSITSTSPDSRYTSGQSINITANFDGTVGAGSKMRLTLNSGASVDLGSVSGSTLSGTYVVGGGDSTPDLTVASISSDSSFTSVFDTSSPGNTHTDFDVPKSPELTGDTSSNLGDLKNIVAGDADYAKISVGTNPYQLATVGNLVYVADQGSNDVKVIDSSTNSVTRTIAVGNQPYGVAYNSTSKEIYVANLKGNSVSVIDADPISGTFNTVTHTITSGMGVEPYYVASLGSKIYVTNNLSWSVSVIDTSTHTVTATVEVGEAPRGIKAHGTDLYVANFGSSYGAVTQGTVSVINSLNNTVTATINVGSGARGVAVNGSEVYVANFNDGTVSVIDTGSNTVTHTITVGKIPRGVLSLGTNIYVENFGDGTVSVINSTLHTVTATIEVGNTPAGMTSVGTNIYLSRFTDGVVSILDTTNNTLIHPPVLSSISSGSPNTSDATITWTTDLGASSQVEFGTTSIYTSSTTLDTTLATSHSVLLSGLNAGTSYHYRVLSNPSSNYLSTSTDQTFTTSAASNSNTIAPGAQTGGSSGGSPITIIYPVTSGTDCAIGDLFSIKTGQPCITVVTSSSGLNATTNTISGTGNLSSLDNYQFSRTITVGTPAGNDIVKLQHFLNLEGFTVSKTGAGSLGHETTVFAAKTKAALILFQKTHGIKPTSGFFGPLTRAYVNGLLNHKNP